MQEFMVPTGTMDWTRGYAVTSACGARATAAGRWASTCEHRMNGRSVRGAWRYLVGGRDGKDGGGEQQCGQCAA